MRCKTCDYPLWDMVARVCPECGAGFKPSDYDFTLNSVRFCCPHCKQAYYGTGPRGHLVPESFACVTCHQPVTMDGMVLLPAEGVRDEQTKAFRQPWLERGKERSFFRAWTGTVGHAMVRPGQLLDATPPESGGWAAAKFLLVNLGVLALVGGVMYLLMVGFVTGLTGRMMGGGGPSPGLGAVIGWSSLGETALYMLGIVAGWAALAALTCGVAHGVLRMTGGCAYGIGRTWQAVCYASGAQIVSLVPCFGGYLGWVWWAVSTAVALKHAQKVSGGRAAVGVMVVPALAVLAFIGAIVFSVYTAASGVNAATAVAMATGGASQVGAVTAALRRSGGAPPRHVADLLADGSVSWMQLYDPTAAAGGNLYPRAAGEKVGGLSVATLSGVNARSAAGAARAAGAALAPSTIAYRVGDMVFTYPGIDPSVIPPGDAAEGLWIVVMEESNAMAGGPAMVHVGLAGGRQASFPTGLMAGELAKQNALRRSVSLPALPDPLTMGVGASATAWEAAPVMAIPAGGTPEPVGGGDGAAGGG